MFKGHAQTRRLYTTRGVHVLDHKTRRCTHFCTAPVTLEQRVYTAAPFELKEHVLVICHINACTDFCVTNGFAFTCCILPFIYRYIVYSLKENC